MNNNKYDIILIGDNLSMYMASIYLQTSNYKQLVINITEPDNLNFEGYDKVAGVINVKDQADLLERMRQQTKNLKVPIIKEEIKNIKKVEEEDIFEIETENGIYYSKSLISNHEEAEIEGLFRTDKNKTNEAIELLGNGCKLSFEVREYFSKYNVINKDKDNRSKVK